MRSATSRERKLFALAVLGASVLATIAGALYSAVHGSTTVGHAVAFAFWVTAAVCLVPPLLRRGFTSMFVTAAFVFTAIGAAVDSV